VRHRTRSSFPRRVAQGLTLAGILASGCGPDEASRQADPEIKSVVRGSGDAPAQVAAPDQEALRVGPFEKSFDGIRLSVPAGWKEVELSPAQQGFIDARFQIPTAHGDVTLTCSSNSGRIETNINRWVGQFHAAGKRPVLEPLDVGGKKATWVDVQGDFDAGPMAGAGPAASGRIERMLGVAIPLGARDFYLKLTGSEAAVADIRTAFREFAREARPTN
jgi:hypothetical protein